MNGKTRVIVGSANSALPGRMMEVLQSRGLGLTRLRSVKEVCEALSWEDVLLVLCEGHLTDGTYEDLLNAARNLRAAARIVVAGSEVSRPGSLSYTRAKELGAFDVLRESYGPKDLEWLVICAMRDEETERVSRHQSAAP